MLRPTLSASCSQRRLALALWLVLALCVQAAWGSARATAMAAAQEVCSATGVIKVDADGKPLASVQHSAFDGCCGSAFSAAPVTPPILPVMQFQHSPPSSLRSAGRISAEWLGALSRGPPLRFDSPSLLS